MSVPEPRVDTLPLERLIGLLGFKVLVDKQGLLEPGREWRQAGDDTLLVTQAFYDKLKAKGDVEW